LTVVDSFEAVVVQLAALGANVLLVGRNPDRLRFASEAADRAGGASLHQKLDALIHNAGAFFHDYGLADDGTWVLTERTLATHVLAPFRLRLLLAHLLRRAEQSIIVTVTSGGMYTQRFDPSLIEAGPVRYRGAVVYARANRAQVVLSPERRIGAHRRTFTRPATTWRVLPADDAPDLNAERTGRERATVMARQAGRRER
jgi:NAD(P)-dependent dehydrogenase (short-subunit alcohol dehydrogenase family)